MGADNDRSKQSVIRSGTLSDGDPLDFEALSVGVLAASTPQLRALSRCLKGLPNLKIEQLPIEANCVLNPSLKELDAVLFFSPFRVDVSRILKNYKLPELTSQTKVLAVVLSQSSQEVESIIKAGFHGCISWPFSQSAFVWSIYLIRTEEVVPLPSWYSPNTNSSSVEPATSKSEPADSRAAPLTRRQAEIIKCVAQGSTNKEIAVQLAVHPSTVQTHLHAIYEKLHVRSRTEALAVLSKGVHF